MTLDPGVGGGQADPTDRLAVVGGGPARWAGPPGLAAAFGTTTLVAVPVVPRRAPMAATWVPVTN